MSANGLEVDMNPKDSLTNGNSNPEPTGKETVVSVTAGAGNRVSGDQKMGKAKTLTVGEFQEEILQRDGGSGGAEADGEWKNHRPGFLGFKKCAVTLAIGVSIAVILTIVLVVLSTRRKESVFNNAAVVTDVDICSNMGRDILLEGGSAVDAAITAQLCVGLVNSQSSGLGGGFFMLIYNATSRQGQFLDARETAPSAADDSYVDSHLNSHYRYGINMTAVPGEVRGLWDAHRKYGMLPWKDLFRPVIQLAEDGFTVTQHLNETLQKLQPLSQYEGQWHIYINEDGSHKITGDTVYNSALANTLKALAENGTDEFYTGATARKIIDEIESLDGILTLDDLAGYSTRWSDVLTSEFGDDYSVIMPSMPSGGPVLQFLINTLKAFNLTSNDFKNSARIKTYHRLIEASKFAFGLRSHLGEENTLDVQQALDALASESHARRVAESIPDDAITHSNLSYYHVTPNVNPTLGGTSHVNVLAANGDAVSLTSSVNYRFGSRVFSKATGMIYNNEMADFSLKRASPNFVRPGKRPLSSMCGSVVVDKEGRVKMVEGSAGSKRIITTNAWIILSTLMGHVELAEAVDERRLHCEVTPNAVRIDNEAGFPEDILEGLRELGHESEETPYISIVQTILRRGGKILAYSDKRKPPGKPAGY